MRGRRLLAVVLSVLVLVGGASSVAVGDGGPETDDGASVCDDVDAAGNVLVAVVPGSNEPLQGDHRFYGQTTLDLRLCSSDGLVTPYGDAWALAAGDGYEILNETDDGPRVRLERGYGQVSFPEAVNRKQVSDGIALVEPGDTAVEPTFENASRLYFSAPEHVESYRTHEAEFLAASNATTAAVGSLEETRAALAEGEELDSNATDTLQTLGDRVATTEARSEAFQRFLYQRIGTSPTPGVAETTLASVERREDESRRSAAEAVAAYRDALDDRASALRSSIRTNVLLGGGLGIVAGLLVGGALPYLVANRTIGRKRIDSSADYTRVALWLPVAGGILALVATLGGLAVVDGLGLLEVIL